MLPATALRALPLDEALASVQEGAAFVDLRPIDSYLDVHIPGSLALLYEFGPGMASRARDCLPLDLPLVLLEAEGVNMPNAAASLRGKGFTVLGRLQDGINRWSAERGAPSSTEIVEGHSAPAGTVLDVGDPGARSLEGSLRIPIERLWVRIHEVPADKPTIVSSGYGVRAALAVGMLERAGRGDVLLWRARA